MSEVSGAGGKILQSDRPIGKADIQAKLAELKSGVDSEIANVRGIAIAAGVTVVVVAVLVTFALGRRRGRRLATIVEIRRGIPLGRRPLSGGQARTGRATHLLRAGDEQHPNRAPDHEPATTNAAAFRGQAGRGL
jgi:hypothetical protein